MSASKHTPGPWEVSGPHHVVGGGKCLAISADTPDGELTVGTVAYNDDNPAELEACWADARLFAAAPALAAAVADLLGPEGPHATPRTLADGERIRASAYAALKKAGLR